MNHREGKPLIRKKYDLPSLLKMVFSSFSGKKQRPLRIPPIAETIEFRSMSSFPDHVDFCPAGPYSREQILSVMVDNDLRGFGGAGFPMARKWQAFLSSKNPDPILIINGVECDPGLYHDKWILENKQKEIEAVVGILRVALDFSHVYLAKKKGTPPVNIKNVITIDVPNHYPAGEEKKLLSWLLGVEPDGSFPAEKGILLHNVQSLLLLYAALSGGPMQRYITLLDLDRRKAIVARCDMDSSIKTLAEVLGKDRPLYLGGGIMQAFPAKERALLDSRINIIAAGEAAVYHDSECRRCGQCSHYCPADLPVEKLVHEIENGNPVAKDLIADCRRCGVCSYICPAGKDISTLLYQ